VDIGWGQGAGTHCHVFLPATSTYLQLFNDAIRLAVSYKHNSRDFMDEVLQELEVGQVEMLDGIKLLCREVQNITQ